MAETHSQTVSDVRRERRVEAQRVTVVSALVNLLLSVVKVAVGWVANSAGLMADGIHSLSDLMSDALVWFAAKHSSEAPDDEHPYGHGRFETAATLALGVLLVLVALGIAWDAGERVYLGEISVPGQAALWAAAFSIFANEALYWYTILVARRIRSDMLRANAWHHRTDAISSVVVLVGVIGAMFGWVYLDAVAAAIVALMILKIGWDLGWDAVQELVDASLDEETVKAANDAIIAVDGVRSVHMLRTRRHGPEAAADVHVQVAPRLSVSEGHMISLAVEERLKGAVEAITDVTVHIDPEDDEQAPPCQDLPLRGEALAQLEKLWPDLPAGHRLTLHYLSGRVDIELRLPLAAFESREQALALREALMADLRDAKAFGRLEVLYVL
jgi:cation diffusion facilitator family transporter